MASVQTVSVTLTNRFAYLTDGPDEVLAQLSDFWSYYVPGARYIPSHKLYIREKARARADGDPDRDVAGWDGKIRFIKGGKVPAGLFRATRSEAAEELQVAWDVDRDLPLRGEFGYDIEQEQGVDSKYHYQAVCVHRMLKAFEHGGCIVLSATGSGKTKVTGDFFKWTQGWDCLFVVDTLDLLYQGQAELEKWLREEVGVVGDSKFTPERVTVATIQTLAKHQQRSDFVKWFKNVKVVVVDELHKQMAKRNFKLLETIKPIARYGLTATLQLKKKPVRMRAYAFAGPVKFEFPIKEATEQGVVSKSRALQLMFDEEWHGGDLDAEEEYKYEVVNNETKHTACHKLVKALIKDGHHVLVLVERVAHVQTMDKVFKDVYHSSAYGKVSKTERKKAMDRFEEGNIRLLIANSVFVKGIDLKRVDVIIDMAERKSKDDVLQKLGRGVRLHEEKEELLFIMFGTKTGRYRKAAVSRARALRAAGIPFKQVPVSTPLEAVQAVKKWRDK